MSDEPGRVYSDGDTFSYVSVTQGYTVTWTRRDGLWHASDEAETQRGPATDDDVTANLGDDADYAPTPGRGLS